MSLSSAARQERPIAAGWTVTLIEGADGALGAQFLSERHPDPEGSRAVLSKASGGQHKVGKSFHFTDAAQVRKAVQIILDPAASASGFALAVDRAASRVSGRQPTPRVTKSTRPGFALAVDRAALRVSGPS